MHRSSPLILCATLAIAAAPVWAQAQSAQGNSLPLLAPNGDQVGTALYTCGGSLVPRGDSYLCPAYTSNGNPEAVSRRNFRSPSIAGHQISCVSGYDKEIYSDGYIKSCSVENEAIDNPDGSRVCSGTLIFDRRGVMVGGC